MSARAGVLEGQVVLVTGASRGIGAAIAEALAHQGALVVVNCLSQIEAAEQVAQRCRDAGGDGWALAADVRDRAAVQRMVDEVLRETGRIDAVVNNALAPYRFDPEQRPAFWDTPWSAYQAQFDGAVQAAYHVCQAVLPGMRQRQAGSIVNLVTDLVDRPAVAYHDYATAKAALVGFSRTLASEVGAFGIRVNGVAPGLVQGTESGRPTREAVREALIAQTPLGRLATAEDVAGAVLFLVSPWSRFVTGQVLVVDGGMVMR